MKIINKDKNPLIFSSVNSSLFSVIPALPFVIPATRLRFSEPPARQAAFDLPTRLAEGLPTRLAEGSPRRRRRRKVGIQRKECYPPAGGNREGGQTMLLMVIIIAATVLTAITFSSFTIVSELRQVTDARASGAALFAADTGVECVLFREFGNAPYGAGCPPCVGDCATPEVELFPRGPKFRFQFISRAIDGPMETVVWEAIGRDASGRTIRSLEITLRKLI